MGTVAGHNVKPVLIVIVSYVIVSYVLSLLNKVFCYVIVSYCFSKLILVSLAIVSHC